MPGEAIQHVIDAITENRRKFSAFCHALNEEQLARVVPGSTWIVRDFAAHLGTLDTALLNWFGAVPTGAAVDSSVGADGQPFDVDEFNDAQAAARRTWTLERVFAEAAENRRMLAALLASLTDEQIERPMHFAGDGKRAASDIPLKLFLQGWAQHDPIHVADMVKALPELAGDAQIAAWLDNPYVAGYQKAMNGAPHG